MTYVWGYLGIFGDMSTRASFKVIYPYKMVIFHSYVAVYQRVNSVNPVRTRGFTNLLAATCDETPRSSLVKVSAHL